MIRVCKTCGKEFEATNSRATVCSDCMVGVCVVCGKTFNRSHPYNQKHVRLNAEVYTERLQVSERLHGLKLKQPSKPNTITMALLDLLTSLKM